MTISVYFQTSVKTFKVAAFALFFIPSKFEPRILAHLTKPMNQDALTHVSRFLPPKDLQTMAIINRTYASVIRYAYQSQEQREPIRAWNRIKKKFRVESVGNTTWMNMNINRFAYLDHVEIMFDIVIENNMSNLILHSEDLTQPTDEQFRNFIHQVVTRKHRLGAITLFYITVTDDMYHHFVQSLRPVINDMPLKFISCNENRTIMRNTFT